MIQIQMLFILLILLQNFCFALDPVVEPVVREWLGMRDCLPGEVSQEIYQWLTEVRDWKHRQFLETQGLLVLNQELRSGAKLCDAMESTLIRILNKHSYTLAQRKSASIPIVEHDGWQETQVKLKELTKYVKKRCVEKRLSESLPPSKVRDITRCMILAEKRASARLMAHHLG